MLVDKDMEVLKALTDISQVVLNAEEQHVITPDEARTHIKLYLQEIEATLTQAK